MLNIIGRFKRNEKKNSLSYSPEKASPFCYDIFKGNNTICNPYDLDISLSEGSGLTDEAGNWMDNKGVDSIYKDDLKALIDSYVEAHENIDADRIIIGGCSNGGYMTMNMIMN